MKQLLYKEFRICFAPQTLLFFLFVLMLLIPNYPFLVAGFFICNGIFFSFQQAVVDNDLLFTAMLPVSKRDAVRGKVWFVVLIQLCALALFAGMVALYPFYAESNAAGIDGSLTLLGALLVLFGLFNVVLLPGYFRSAHKIGKHFLKALIVVFVWITVFEGTMIAAFSAQQYVPLFAWIEANLDCFPSTASAWMAQVAALAIGLFAYAGLTLLAEKKAIRAFEQVDL